jgi:hypothetical protein
VLPAFVDERLIPEPTVLLLDRHEVTRWVEAGSSAGELQRDQREQRAGLVLVGHQLDQQAAETPRLSSQVIVRLAITLVEDQVQHGEHAARAFGE